MSIHILKGIHRRVLGLSKDDQVVGKNGFVGGGDGKPAIVLPGSPDTTAVFDDFHGDVVADQWNVVEGDTGAGSASTVVAGTNGIFRLYSTSGVATAAPSEGQAINGGLLSWKANQGPGVSGRLRFGARLKLGSVSRTTNRLHVFAGFTDVTSFEHPIYDTGAGVQSQATDAVGFMFSPGGDTGWSAVAVANDTDRTAVSLDPGVVANAYDTIEVEINRGVSDTGGMATFYVNGVPRGSISSPVTSTVALTPVISVFKQDTGGDVVDVDWINVAAPRDTGL